MTMRFQKKLLSLQAFIKVRKLILREKKLDQNQSTHLRAMMPQTDRNCLIMPNNNNSNNNDLYFRPRPIVVSNSGT